MNELNELEQAQTSNELDHVHLLVIELEYLIFSSEQKDIEHRTW